MAEILITPEKLEESARQFRQELLLIPLIALQATTQHMQIRTGVYSEQVVGQIQSVAEFGPYDPNRRAGDVTIKGRTLRVERGSVIQDFDPNDVWQSVYASLLMSGEGLKGVPITKAILAAMMMNMSSKLNLTVFAGVRNDTGTLSKDLFNGFDTIAQSEITAGEVSVAKKNLFQFTDPIDNTNAVTLLREYYRAATDELREQPVKLFMPQAVYDAYVDDYQQTVGPVVYNRSFEKLYLEGSRGLCELVPLASKRDSGFLQITPRTNMLVGTGNVSDLDKIEVGKYAPLLISLTAVIRMGVQYESIAPEKIIIGKLAS